MSRQQAKSCYARTLAVDLPHCAAASSAAAVATMGYPLGCCGGSAGVPAGEKRTDELPLLHLQRFAEPTTQLQEVCTTPRPARPKGGTQYLVLR
jgi:hypothetical protein